MDPPPIYQPQPPPVAAGAYPPGMANNNFLYSAYSTPNYTGVAVNPPHPTYPEMITAAISRLMEIPRVRTSKKEIAECIAGSYNNLPPSYMRVVTEYLKRMTEAGQLVRVGNSYLLPLPPGSGSDLPQPPAPAPAPAPAQGPAPAPAPAPAASPAPASAAAASSSGAAGSSSLKKRGRPPKPKSSPAEPLPASGEAQVASAALVNGAETSAKKRGRPRKVKPDPAVAGVFNHQEPEPQPAVYNASPVSIFNGASATPVLVNGSASLPKRRGRPRKDSATPVAQTALALLSATKSSSGRRRGRPRKFAVDTAAAPPSTGRPRGRPRKDAVAAAGGVIQVGMKRRGRPRGSVAGARRPLIGRTGRPLGRPRKYAQAVVASDGRAKEELTRKLEYMQFKVRSAVGLLKPHLINANIIDIMTALQDLEELATMDITVPTEATPVPVPISEPSASAPEPSAPPAEPPAPPSYTAYPGGPSQPPAPVEVDTSLGMSG